VSAVSEGIEKMLHTLRLGGLAKSWKEVEYRDREQYVRTLLELELREREVNRINRLVKTAGFRVLKTLEDFEWTSAIQMPQGVNREELETFRFVERKENLILLGAVGTGKTHLATGIALRACQSGKRARFFTAASLGNTLLEKNQKKSLSAFLETLKKVDLMVLDEVGFVPLHQEAAELLFQVISDCYEQKSLIITSNLEFRQWNTIFGDNRLTAALVDRLIHHSHIVVFSGDSYRLKQSVQRQRSH
jgi:DNA replication protein DnaC